MRVWHVWAAITGCLAGITLLAFGPQLGFRIPDGYGIIASMVSAVLGALAMSLVAVLIWSASKTRKFRDALESATEHQG
jgi:hypothetical protein